MQDNTISNYTHDHVIEHVIFDNDGTLYPEPADVKDKHVTGLLYFQEGIPTLDETENLVDTPLSELSEDMLRPSKKSLDELLTNFRS